MYRVEGFAAAGLPADYRHAGLWQHAFDKSWRWCCQLLTQPLGLGQRFALCLGSRCEFFFGLCDLSFGIRPRIALVVDVLRNLVIAIEQRRHNRVGHVATPQHLVDYPPHFLGALADRNVSVDGLPELVLVAALLPLMMSAIFRRTRSVLLWQWECVERVTSPIEADQLCWAFDATSLALRLGR